MHYINTAACTCEHSQSLTQFTMSHYSGSDTTVTPDLGHTYTRSESASTEPVQREALIPMSDATFCSLYVVEDQGRTMHCIFHHNVSFLAIKDATVFRVTPANIRRFARVRWKLVKGPEQAQSLPDGIKTAIIAASHVENISAKDIPKITKSTLEAIETENWLPYECTLTTIDGRYPVTMGEGESVVFDHMYCTPSQGLQVSSFWGERADFLD